MANINTPKNSATRGTRHEGKAITGKFIHQNLSDEKPRVYHIDLNERFQPDKFSLSLYNVTFPAWLPERIRRQAEDALRGFTEDMALEIADNLIDCWCYGVRHYTGIKHVDRLLNSMYNRILFCAREKGIELKGNI